MCDVGEQKCRWSGKATEFEKTCLLAVFVVVILIIFLEMMSDVAPSFPVGNFYAQAKCRVHLPLLAWRWNATDERLGDVEREIMRTKMELMAAEGAVSAWLRDDLKERKVQSGLVEAIAERDRLVANLEDLRKLRVTLYLACKDLDAARRQTVIEIAKLEAKYHSP
jgi:hypothetical protein